MYSSVVTYIICCLVASSTTLIGCWYRCESSAWYHKKHCLLYCFVRIRLLSNACLFCRCLATDLVLMSHLYFFKDTRLEKPSCDCVIVLANRSMFWHRNVFFRFRGHLDYLPREWDVTVLKYVIWDLRSQDADCGLLGYYIMQYHRRFTMFWTYVKPLSSGNKLLLTLTGICVFIYILKARINLHCKTISYMSSQFLIIWSVNSLWYGWQRSTTPKLSLHLLMTVQSRLRTSQHIIP
jgi:hypothetical protein